MRKTFTLLLAATWLSLNVFATERILQGAEASAEIEGTSLIRYKDNHTIPNHVKFKPEDRINLSEWQSWMLNGYYKNRTDVSFVRLDEQVDKLGMLHERYQQLINGKKVSFGIWIVHSINGEVHSMNGMLFDQQPSSQVSLTEAQALQLALDQVGANTYMWEIPEEEEWLQMEQNDPTATYFPAAELEFINEDVTLENVDLKLAYKFDIYAHEPLARKEIYIDAQNGDFLFENDRIHHVDSNATAHTGYSGIRTIVTDYTGSQFRLREEGRGNGVYTFDLNNTTSGGNGSDIFNATNVWNPGGIDAYALDAHFGAEMTYDYFFNNFNRNSIDGNGFQLISRVHYGVNYVNAFWDGSRMTYGDGNAAFSPLTTLDIAGHEIAHGLTNFTSNLVYQDEPGALNESFSDIFGAAVEFYALGFNNGDWLMGEDIGNAFRSLSNPNIYGDPDTYLGQNWYIGPNDNGGVHINSGVQNYWFHLLTVGGTGTNDLGDDFDVVGIGVNDAEAIAYRNNVVYLTVTSDYEDAYYFAMQSALDLFGPCSQQLSSCANAWYACGLGYPTVPYVDADFTSNTTGNCYVPMEVQFDDRSSNATSRLWDFGDGTTSTFLNPTHTYTTAGEYTVRLIVNSTCGADTTEYVNYIKVGPDAPCEVVLPETGVATRQGGCTGVIYDNGGPGNPYSNEANNYVVIFPSSAGSVSLDVEEFNVQTGNNGTCSADYLEVFDGFGLNAPLLGRFCNANPPTSTITSSSNAMTVRFFSDDQFRKDGFKASWTCNDPTIAPEANFTASTTETCDGEVSFTDLSINGTSQWLWDFGDGNTSTLQNPTHVYSEGGTYTVQLTVSNAIGSDDVTRASYIVVTRPDAPTVETAQVCPGEQANLTATGGDRYFWYDDPNATNAINEGGSFTTPAIQTTRTYYVESVVEGQEQSTGELGNGIGTGGYNGFPASLYFDAEGAFVLHSVKVYSITSGERLIELVDDNNDVIDSRVMDIPFGQHIIDLDFYVRPGEDYQLRASGGTINLYANSSGADYPYEIPGLLSIKRSSGVNGTTGYNFFYDWKVKEFCVSERTPAVASTAICLGVEELEDASFQVFPNPNNGVMQVSFADNRERQIRVFDMSGKVVWSHATNTDQTTINLEGFAKGLYSIEAMEQNGTRQAKRVVLQ
jgi:Zn-dependent metalloprotease